MLIFRRQIRKNREKIVSLQHQIKLYTAEEAYEMTMKDIKAIYDGNDEI